MDNLEKQKKIIIPDEWLSKIIGKPVYYLKQFSNSFENNDLPKNGMFVWSKIPVDDVEKLIQLQKLGFYLVDTNIELVLSKQMVFKKSSNARFAKLSDEIAIRSIAKSTFKYNRFYKDPNISDNIASNIKEEWAGNFFSGKRGKWMIVVEENSKTVGFLQIIESNNDTIIMDLIDSTRNLHGSILLDILDDGYSAVYSFFNPLSEKRGLGKNLILRSLELLKLYNKDNLYLGYWVKDSNTMNYKSSFEGLELFINGEWKSKS